MAPPRSVQPHAIWESNSSSPDSATDWTAQPNRFLVAEEAVGVTPGRAEEAGRVCEPRTRQGCLCDFMNLTISLGAQAGYTCPPGWMKVLTGTGPFVDG